MSQRDDLAATVAIVAFAAQLILAQLTLATVICFVVVGKLTRWRPLWLVLPGAAGIAWLLAVGVKPAVTGYLACATALLRVARHGTLAAKAEGLSDVLAAWRLWLPGQLPIALIVAAGQAAALAVRPRRTRTRRPYRTGALVAARSGYLTATLRRGELATRDGCCLGITTDTGRRAEVSWREAEAGVLCAGQRASAVSMTGRDLAIAAIQHRKAVIIVDLAGDAETAGPAGSRKGLAGLVESECAAIGAPLRQLGPRGARYDPFSAARPARATSLAMAMIDWSGVAHARQLFCANYLNAALTVLAARAPDATASGAATLEDLARLMTPGALRASLGKLRGGHPAAGSLAARVAELSGQLDADQSILAPMAAQFAALNAAALASLLRSSGGSSISLAGSLAGREVVLFPLDRSVLGAPATMIGRLAVADLIEHLAERSDLGSRVDCLVWITGCEAIDHRQLAVLVALGERTGTAVVLGTALGSAAARLAADVNVVAVRGASPSELITWFADPGGHAHLDEMAKALAKLHVPGRRDALSFGVGRPEPRLVAGCKVVR